MNKDYTFEFKLDNGETIELSTVIYSHEEWESPEPTEANVILSAGEVNRANDHIADYVVDLHADAADRAYDEWKDREVAP